jgi:hypothetical protein
VIVTNSSNINKTHLTLWNRKKSTEHTDGNCPGLIQAYKGGGIKPVNGILVFDSLAFELAIIWHHLINEIHFDCILSNTMTRQSKKSITNRRRCINYWNWHLDVNGMSCILNYCYVFSGNSSSEMPGQDIFDNDIQSKVSIRLSSYLMKVITETRRTHWIRYLRF